MAKRSKKTGAKNGQNNLLLFFAIIIILAIISTIIAFYYQDEFKETAPDDQQQTEVKTTNLEGTWVSNYDGKMLSINGLNITIESPSVDETGRITGRISIEENIITFVYTTGICETLEGHYLYSINEDGEVFFKLIKDSCESRIEHMTMTWFKL